MRYPSGQGRTARANLARACASAAVALPSDGVNDAPVPGNGNGRRRTPTKRARGAPRASAAPRGPARAADAAVVAPTRTPAGAAPASSRVVKIALVQMRCDPDPAANVIAAVAHVEEAAARG